MAVTVAIVAAAAALAVLTVAVTVAGLARVDATWRTHRRTCCRCRRTWRGVEKLCVCGGAGCTDPPVAVRTPTHDWQGNCDTGPIPVVARQKDRNETVLDATARTERTRT